MTFVDATVGVMCLGNRVAVDAEGLVRFNVATLTDLAGISLRFLDSNNFYSCIVGNTSQTITFRRNLASSFTTIGTPVNFSYSAGPFYWMRFRAQGTNLYAKAWADGTVEPANWMMAATDSGGITTPGFFGIVGGPTGAGNIVQFDSFSVDDTLPPGPLSQPRWTLRGITGKIFEAAPSVPLPAWVDRAITGRIVRAVSPTNIPHYVRRGMSSLLSNYALNISTRFRLRSQYSATILAESPLRYYRLGELAGTNAVDLGSQAQDGTLHGGITLGQAGLLRNDPDKSELFDGSSGYISLPTTGLPVGANAISLECWLKFPTVPGVGVYGIAIGLGTNAVGQAISIYSDAAQKLTASIQNAVLVQGPSIVQNVLYHCVATYNGSTLNFYVNGISQGTANTTANFTYGIASIGQDIATGLFFAGIIDEVAIYSTALNSTKVINHYTIGLGVNGKDIPSRLRLMSALQLKDVATRFRLVPAAQLKDVTARLRLRSADQLQDITARFRLMSTLQLKDIAARFRLMSAGQLRDIVARLRLKSADQLRDITARLRLMSVSQLRDITARLRLKSADQLKDITARFRLAKFKDIAARLRLMSALQLKDIASRLRLMSAAQLKDVATRLRLMSALQQKDVTTRFRLAILKNIAARFRLMSASQLKDITTRFILVIAGQQTKDIVARFRLKSADQLKNISLRFRLMSAAQLKDVISRFRLKSADQLKDIAVRLKLKSADQLKDIVGRFRLLSATQLRDIAARFRLMSAGKYRDIASRFILGGVGTTQMRDVSCLFRLSTPLIVAYGRSGNATGYSNDGNATGYSHSGNATGYSRDGSGIGKGATT
jgi:uncharacterized phage-associated protein